MKTWWKIVALAAMTAMLGTACLDELAAREGITFGLFIQNNTAAERALVLEHSDGTTNHGLSWSTMQPSRDTWNFAPADATNTFATANGLTQTGFHFAWDQQLLDDLAPWVLGITDPDELREVLAERARVIFERYPDLDRIDIINEPFELLGAELYENHFWTVLGPDYVAELLTIVDEAAPDEAELIVNENFIEYSEAKADALVALATDLVERDLGLDGVGLQSHFLFGEPNWNLYRSTMTRLSALGLDVHITELDVPVHESNPDQDKVQSDRYRNAVSACVEVARCRSITIWGAHDGASWLDSLMGPGNDPLLFDEAQRAKPAFIAVVDALTPE